MTDDEYWAAIPIDNREPPDILYHYTTGAGLLGIIENHVLRATDMGFLNDRNEFVTGLDIASEILIDRMREKPAAFRNKKRRALYSYSYTAR